MSTLKKDIIALFAHSTNTELLANNQVIFLTSLGMIVGDFPTEEDDSNPETAMISILVEKASEFYADKELSGNDGYIQLVNARLISTDGKRVNMGDVVLFHDQIIGVKLGNIT